jgi:hypothetical protein
MSEVHRPRPTISEIIDSLPLPTFAAPDTPAAMSRTYCAECDMDVSKNCGTKGCPIAKPLPAAPAPTRATAEQEAEIDAAVKAGRITFEPGWDDPRPAAAPTTQAASEVMPSPMYFKALALAHESGRASVAQTQRVLSIGWSEAENLIDLMIQRGDVEYAMTSGLRPARQAPTAAPKAIHQVGFRDELNPSVIRWLDVAEKYIGGLAPDVTRIVFDSAARQAPDSRDTALEEVIGCFAAARVEGLDAALMETSDRRLKDLVERRLMYAYDAAVIAREQSKMSADIERAAFEAARHRGVFKPAPDACPKWLATQLREEGWQARAAEGQAEAWRHLFFSVAQILHCLPSQFLDGNAHVLAKAQKAIAALDAAPLPRQAAVQGEWSEKPPTEQAWYWHWNGDPDAAPFVMSVLYSGSAKKCFVSRACTSSGMAEMCDEYGGYWMRMIEPATPAEIDAAPTVKASQ